MSKVQRTDNTITVIGGGPSGMMAAISAAKHGKTAVKILEKNEFLGRKLLATGNGRCNLTNINCKGVQETLELFSEIGLLTRVEAEGRVYPYSEQAATVLEVLINALKKLQVEILCGFEVRTLERKEFGFQITSAGETLHSDAVILAVGGKAGPQYGSTGDGYRLAKTLGHAVIRPMPSLVQILSEQSFFRNLKGVRAKGQVELLRKNEVIDQETGEIQFTENGLSGICIFNLSRNYIHGDRIRIDLFPEYSVESMNHLLVNRVKSLGNSDMNTFFTGMIHKKLIPVILDENSLDENRMTGSLSREDIIKIVQFLKGWNISTTGTKGWKEAQVTSGGLELAEVDLKSMESKLIPKLYFAGELLDVDEKCGGYNLQWAWSSGFTAGKSAAAVIGELSC